MPGDGGGQTSFSGEGLAPGDPGIASRGEIRGGRAGLHFGKPDRRRRSALEEREDRRPVVFRGGEFGLEVPSLPTREKGDEDHGDAVGDGAADEEGEEKGSFPHWHSREGIRPPRRR